MTTKTEIVSGAFTNLGRGSVSDVDSPSAQPIVVTASKKYDLLLINYLGNFPWRFAMLTRDLTLLEDTPPVKIFAQAFQLPSDYINMRKLRPQGAPYQLYEDKIYINSNEVQIDYTAKVTEDKFPAWFTLFMEYRLTADMAMPVTQDRNLLGDWTKMATSQLLSAKYQDSQQQPNDVMVNDPILAAHYGAIRRSR